MGGKRRVRKLIGGIGRQIERNRWDTGRDRKGIDGIRGEIERK